MDPKQLEELKIETIRLLETLQTRVDICVNSGMLDKDSEIYNHLYDLIEDTKEITTGPELMEIINKAKVVETNIDRWLSTKGQTTISLSWPYIEE